MYSISQYFVLTSGAAAMLNILFCFIILADSEILIIFSPFFVE